MNLRSSFGDNNKIYMLLPTVPPCYLSLLKLYEEYENNKIYLPVFLFWMFRYSLLNKTDPEYEFYH